MSSHDVQASRPLNPVAPALAILDGMSKNDGSTGLEIAGQVLDVLRSGIAAKQTPPRPHTDDEKADAIATLAAYHELGPEYQEAVAESFLSRLDQQMARRNADLVAADRRNADLAKKNAGVTVGMLAVCLAMAIPLTAIAMGYGIAAVGLVWGGIILVAFALGFGRRRS